MSQLNLNVTPDFLRDLKTVMKKKHLTRKSDAIRIVVHEAAAGVKKRRDFEALLGALAKYPKSKNVSALQTVKEFREQEDRAMFPELHAEKKRLKRGHR